MTNKEKYGNEIIELAINTGLFCVKNGEPVLCAEIKCKDCDFLESDSCKGGTHIFREWLNSEYVEPPVDWSKVAVDTPILVRATEDSEWTPRYFAKYENGRVYAWGNGSTSWSAEGNMCVWEFAKLVESEEQAWRD